MMLDIFILRGCQTPGPRGTFELCGPMFNVGTVTLHPALPHPISLPPSYPIIGNQRCLREGGYDGVQMQLEEGTDPLFGQKADIRGFCCCCYCCHGYWPF